MDCSLQGSSIHGILQARRVGCHFLQGIFLTQGCNRSLWCLLHCQAGSLPLAPPTGCYNCYSKKKQNHLEVEHRAQSSLLSFLTCKFSLETFDIFIFCRFQLHYLNPLKKLILIFKKGEIFTYSTQVLL